MPERLEIRYVERSSREIESSRAAAADAVERIKADTGVAISSIRVDPPTNRVVIAVDALTPAKEALLRTRLGGSYASEQKTDAKPEQRQETRSDSPGQLKRRARDRGPLFTVYFRIREPRSVVRAILPAHGGPLREAGQAAVGLDTRLLRVRVPDPRHHRPGGLVISAWTACGQGWQPPPAAEQGAGGVRVRLRGWVIIHQDGKAEVCLNILESDPPPSVVVVSWSRT